MAIDSVSTIEANGTLTGQPAAVSTAKDLAAYYAADRTPPGLRTNAVQWLQRKVMAAARALPHRFDTVAAWEQFRDEVRRRLPAVIGRPEFPPLRESVTRGRVRVGNDVICERVDVHVDADYAIPAFVFVPAARQSTPLPACVWNPGWPESKFKPSYCAFGARMARQGVVVLVPDHAPFGETTFMNRQQADGMSLIMGMGNVLGISQLALRSAETSRCGEYLRARDDVDAARVAVAGLCQGGMDTWLSAALDDGFCAAAPFCSESTFAQHFAEMASYRANGDSSPFPFGILGVCDIEHLHAAIAPRPLLVRSNLCDDWWPVSGFDDVEHFTRGIYRLYGAEQRVSFRAAVHEHDLSGPFADALEQFLLEQV